MFNFVFGFLSASALWFVGVLTIPRIKAWYKAIDEKVKEVSKTSGE